MAKTKILSPQKSTYWLDVREIPVVQAKTTGHRIFSHLDPYITTQAIFLSSQNIRRGKDLEERYLIHLQENKLKAMDKNHDRKVSEPGLQPSEPWRGVLQRERCDGHSKTKAEQGKHWGQHVCTSGWEVPLLGFYTLVNAFHNKHLLLTVFLFWSFFNKWHFNTHFGYNLHQTII